MSNSVYKPVSGFTLIELMIAMTIGLFILGAVSAVAINSGRNARANDRTSELQTNGRYALDVMRRDIQHAGNSGLLPGAVLQQSASSVYPVFTITNGVAVAGAAAGTVADCSSGFALQLQQSIYGVDNTTPNPYTATCIPSNVSGTDILVVRYGDMSNEATVATATPGVSALTLGSKDIYFRSSYAQGMLFQNGTTTPTVVGTGPMEDQLLRTFVYYISPNTVASPADGIPSLWRVNLTNGAMTPELVASGIENLQVRYGFVDANNNTQYFDANNVTNWANVQSVRVWLLARNSKNEVNEAYVNAGPYVMGNVSFVPPASSQQYRRQLYTTTIDMRN